MHTETFNFQEFRLFLQFLTHRMSDRLGEKIFPNERDHPLIQPRRSIQRRDEHVQLNILLQLLSWVDRYAQDSSRDTIRDNMVDYKELDTILILLQQIMSEDSLSSHQDIFTIASYTYHFISRDFTTALAENSSSMVGDNNVVDTVMGSLYNEGHPRHTHNLSWTKPEAIGQRPKKRKRDEYTSSILEENRTPGVLQPLKNSVVDDSYAKNNTQLLWNKILQMVIESLTCLREGHNQNRSPLYEAHTMDKSTSDAGSMEDPHLYSIARYFADTPLHHYYHLAVVLCRVAIPECPSLLLHLARHGSHVSSDLVRGCIDAFKAANHAPGKSYDNYFFERMQNIAKESIQRIAHVFYSRDRIHIISMLRQYRILPDVFLSLLMQQEENDMTFVHILLSEMLYSTCIPLSRRNMDGKTIETHVQSASVNCVQDNECWIQNYLRMNTNMIHSMVIRLTNHLVSLNVQGDNISWGKASLIVQTIALFLLTVDVKIEESGILIANAITSVVQTIPLYFQNRHDNMGDFLVDDTVPLSSPADDFLKMSFCLCIILSMPDLSSCANIPSSLPTFQLLFEKILLHRVSKKFIVFVSDVFNILNGEQDEDFQCLLRHISSYPNIHLSPSTVRMFCEWSRSLLHPTRETVDPLPPDVHRLGDEAEWTIAQNILNDPQQCREIMQGRHLFSVHHIIKKVTPIAGVPLVLPLQIEKLEKALRLNFPCPVMDHSIADRFYCQYLLQIMYCLLFVDKLPSSPFAIGSRALSLDNVLFLANESSRSLDSSEADVSVVLCLIIAKHCPDVVASWKVSQHGRLRIRQSTYGMNVVCATLKSSILGPLSCCNLRFDENLFFLSRAFCPFKDVDTNVLTILLESVESRRLFVSYKSLIQDPLQILKVPLAQWLSAGVCNVLASILQGLFITHTALSMRQCPSTEVVIELLLARDAIALKCFTVLLGHLKKKNRIELSLSSGPDNGYYKFLTDHDVLLNCMRWIIAQRRGLFALVSLESNSTVDQIAAVVPECVLDFATLSRHFARSELMIADRVSFSERLLGIVSLFSSHGAIEVLVSSVLSFVASLPFRTESGRLAPYYDSVLRILASIESIPTISVEMADMKLDARCVLRKIQGNRRKQSTVLVLGES